MTNLHTSSIQKCKTIRRNNVGLHNRLLPLKKKCGSAKRNKGHHNNTLVKHFYPNTALC